MNVKELIDYLKTQDQDLEVLFCQYSDFSKLYVEEIEIEQGVNKGEWIERYYPRQYTDDNRPDVKDYLVFPGN